MIFKRLVHIVLATIGCLGAVSCSDSGDGPDVPVAKEDTMVNLTFSVVAPSATAPQNSRAGVVIVPDKDNYFEQAANKYELIHTLRIVIIRNAKDTINGVVQETESPRVEHNKLFVLSESGVVRYDDMKFLVRGGEKKRIYILANEAAVPYDFTKLEIGQLYNNEIESVKIEAGDNGVLFDNSGENKVYIPMCEVYDNIDVPIPQHPEEYYMDAGMMFITRAAVKFTFSVQAPEGSGLYLKDVTFNTVANKEFFLPNETTYEPAKEENPLENWEDADDPDLYGRFITTYTTPTDTVCRPVTIAPEGGIAFGQKPVTWTPPLYFCETGLIAKEELTTPYSVGITIAVKDEEGNFVEGSELTFAPKPLQNLPTLPRNTHVKVNITLTSSGDINFVVIEAPFNSVELKPGFGDLYYPDEP